MAITYGFFNSSDGDRVYNADDVNTFLEGLISSSGIFANVDNMFQVTSASDMAINVGSGKAMINNHWVRNNAAETITLNAAHALLNRYDAIVLRLEVTNRDIILTTIEGTNATTPVKPSIQRSAQYYDLCLAYVYVPAGSTAISQSNIEDTRLNSSLCGLITGLVQQLDTSQFYAQLEAWKTEQQSEFETWQSGQESAFETWFSTLTDELAINTYIEEYTKNVAGTNSEIEVIDLDMDGYTYSPDDILFISINGLAAIEVNDYLLNTNTTPVEVHLNLTSSSTQQNEIGIKVLKSVIGQRPSS